MLLLESNNIPEETINALAYLTQFASKTNFFIYQGHDGRTMMHRDVRSYDGHTFKCHELTYETYIGNNLLPCPGIIITHQILDVYPYEISETLMEDTKMMTLYTIPRNKS